MYTLIRSTQVRELVSEQVPLLGASLGIAEALYKFHSFALECLAFLATWYVLDVLVYLVRKRFESETSRA